MVSDRISLKWSVLFFFIFLRCNFISSQCNLNRRYSLMCNGMTSNITTFPRLEPNNLVKKLLILHTNLTSLQNGNITLPASPNLTVLVLYSNGIRILKRSFIKNCASIQRLDLSRNMLTAVPIDVLEELRDLRHLALSGNKILMIKAFTFRLNPLLEKLYLSHNNIQEIEEHALSGVYELNYLDLSTNCIAQFPFAETQYLPRLGKIYLSFNQLSILNGKNKRFSSAIQMIKIDFNYLQYLDDYILNIFPNLQYLYANENHISEIGILAYGKRSYNLSSIVLNNNALTKIDVPFFRKLPMLEKINLAFNRLTVLPKDAFVANPNLRTVDLSCNQIHFVHVTAFMGIPYLERIDFTFNKLTSLSSDIFDGIEENFNLLLDGNNFTCDCYNRHIQEWLNKTPSYFVDILFCLIPEYGNYTQLISYDFDKACKCGAERMNIHTTDATLTMSSSKTLEGNLAFVCYGVGVAFFVAFTATVVIIIIKCVPKTNRISVTS